MARKTATVGKLIASLVLLVSVVAAGIVGLIYIANLHAEATSNIETLKGSKVSLKEKLSQKLTQKRQEEEEERRLISEQEIMAEYGYTSIEDGLYFRYLKKNEYGCGYWDCVGVAVSTGSGKTCPSMIYIEANILRSGTVISWTNTTIGSLGEWSTATALLEDVRGQGDTIRITKINCY